MNNFLGKDGYVWWVGVVENIEDPLKIGRCKIRIFGWHTENLQLLPTNELPWASPASASNGGQSFSVPTPGDYVTGYFADVSSAQNPYYTSVLPGIQAQAPDTSKGFSPQPLIPNKPPTPTEEATPELPPGVTAGGVGQPTVVPIARGIVAGTGISLTNASLTHVCDFRYKFQFDIGLSGITNPVTAITNAIKNGKNNAANFIGFLIKKLNDTIRTAIKAVISALGIDPSGTTSVIYGYVKGKLQDINDFIEQVAEYVEIASTVYYLIKDINEIVAYLQSLPARFLAALQDCITTFLNGAKAFGAQIAAVPGQVGATVATLAGSLQAGADAVISGLNNDVSGVTIPDSMAGIFTDPHLDHSNTIITYINTMLPNTNTAMATANSTNYDPTKVQWA